jgi:hypothetical protein
MNASDYTERLKTTGRNDPCPCGSGKKYKKCHLPADEAARHEELAKAAEEREAVASAADEGDGNDEDDTESNQTRTRDVHRHTGKTRGGTNRHVNIPRRGAV